MKEIITHAGAVPQRDQAVADGVSSGLPGVDGGLSGDLGADELAPQQSRFRHLWQVLERISRGTTMDEVLNFIFDEFSDDIPFDRIAFATYDHTTDRVVTRWARSRSALQIAPGYSRKLSDTSLAKVFKSDRPRIIGDLAAYLSEHPSSDGTSRLLGEDLQSSLTCPLLFEGRPSGFLFFNSKMPHAYSDSHVSFFMQLSVILGVFVERGRLYDELLEQKATVERQKLLLGEENRRHRKELILAKKVQRSLINGSLPREGKFVTEMFYQPAATIGGDLVDCISLDESSSLVYVADAMGHGVAAALIMSVVRTAFHGALAGHNGPGPPSPADLLGEVNRTLMEMFDQQYVTAVCALVDSDTRKVTFSLAGHPPALLLHRTPGSVQEIAARHIPLGISGLTGYTDIQVPFEAGDVLLLYTDGAVEAEDKAERAFGSERLKTLLERSHTKPIAGILGEIREGLQSHIAGAALEDDLTLLVVQLLEYEGSQPQCGEHLGGSEGIIVSER